MRIALFGGTFDPPHRGHAAIAQAAAKAFALDEVIFAPTGRQPLKLDGPATAFAFRLAMTQAACADLNAASSGGCRFTATDLDRPREDGRPNYTVDALDALRAKRPGDAIFHLVGADAFLSLPRWKGFPELLDLAEWIVVSRPGYAVSDEVLQAMHLTAERRSRVHLLHSVAEDVSATELRARLAAGEACEELLLPGVASYIVEHHLYRT